MSNLNSDTYDEYSEELEREMLNIDYLQRVVNLTRVLRDESTPSAGRTQARERLQDLAREHTRGKSIAQYSSDSRICLGIEGSTG